MLTAREGGQPKYQKKEGGALTKRNHANYINHTNHTNHINHICSQREKEGSQNIKRRKGGPLQNVITPITSITPITLITSITYARSERRRAAKISREGRGDPLQTRQSHETFILLPNFFLEKNPLKSRKGGPLQNLITLITRNTYCVGKFFPEKKSLKK